MRRTAAMIVAAALFHISGAFAVDLHGHRGARGLSPENSIAGFRRAIEIGVDCLELDVGMSSDGKIVISHDRRLNRDLVRRGGQWVSDAVPLNGLSSLELRTLDIGRIKPGSDYAARFPGQVPLDGETMPMLSDLLALPDLNGMSRPCFNIEIKTSPDDPGSTFAPERISRRLVQTLDAAGRRSNAMVQSFDWRSLVFLKKFAPDIPLVFLSAEQSWGDTLQVGEAGASPWTAGIDIDDFEGSAPRAVKHLGGTVWSPYFRELTREALDLAHALGLKVVVWTVNSEDDMRRLIAMGVDGIITDYPDRAARVMELGDSRHRQDKRQRQ